MAESSCLDRTGALALRTTPRRWRGGWRRLRDCKRGFPHSFHAAASLFFGHKVEGSPSHLYRKKRGKDGARALVFPCRIESENVNPQSPVRHNQEMLVLASASPRRSELLKQAGFSFTVRPADIPEDPFPDEDPIVYVTRLALAKAQEVYGQLGDSSAAVLGADTTVIVDSQILGKPVDAADAARMLRMLSGRFHLVATGVALVTADSAEATAEVTTVFFNDLSDSEIAEYVATGEPMDKAGAYAIQGLAARWIPRIEGCYFNVVGLPIARVSLLMQSL